MPSGKRPLKLIFLKLSLFVDVTREYHLFDVLVSEFQFGVFQGEFEKSPFFLTHFHIPRNPFLHEIRVPALALY